MKQPTAHKLNTASRYSMLCMLLMVYSLAFGKVKDSINVQFKWKHQFQFAGFYAAVENGYYAQAGLAVNLIPGGVNIDNIDQVISQKAQFGVESPKLLLALNNGKPVVVLASIFQHSPEGFITLAEYNIQTIADFKNLSIGLSRDNLPSTQGSLVKENMMDSVNIVRSEGRIDQLMSGELKVIDGYFTDLPYQLNQLGYHPAVITPLSYGIDFYGDCVYTSQGYLKNHPKTVKAFLDATLKGWVYAMQNKQKVAEHIVEKYETNHTVNELMYEARVMEGLILPNFVEIGYTSRARWQHIAETYVTLGWLKKDYTLDKFLYNEFLEDKSLFQNRIIYLSIIGLILLLATLGYVFIFNRRLKKAVIKQTHQIWISNVQLRNEIENSRTINKHLKKTTKRLKSNKKDLRNKNEILQERTNKIEQINQELKLAKLKAEESDRLKSAFLSNMSHEIRTPMNGIVGFSELLKQQDITANEKDSFIKIIDDNSLQLLDIISDIIDISKIEVGEISINKENTEIKNLFEILRSNFALKCKQLKNNSVTLSYEIKEGVETFINTDPTRLKQIISNLLDNAIKFTTEGSIYFAIEKNTDHYIFTVRDTGSGISQDKVEKVFDRFFKDQNQFYNNLGGTGLGLSIAKNLVELLGGKITLKSQQNKGCEFSFTHPL